MQQDNYIQNRLKELDDMQAPDISRVEEHWQQMNAMLQPVAAKPTASPLSRNFIIGLVIIVLIIAGTGTFLLSSYIKGDAVDTKSLLAGSAAEATNLSLDNFEGKEDTALTATIIPITKQNSQDIYLPGWDDVSQSTNSDSLFSNVKINFTPCSTCPVKKKDSMNSNINRRMLLESLFEELSKPQQQFLIDNRKDTVLFALEGTAVYIPKGAFNWLDSINISLAEYYSYSDMILNRLITKSNDRQLISGGMINIQAEKNGNRLSIAGNNQLRVFIPGITAKDSFQVFYGETGNVHGDTAALGYVNWQLSSTRISSPAIEMFVRAVDLRDNLASVTYGRRTKAVFRQSKESSFSREELKQMLQKKYGNVYDKIKVKRQRRHFSFIFRNVFDDPLNTYGSDLDGIGDTTTVTPVTIKMYNLKAIDTVYRAVWGQVSQNTTVVPSITPAIYNLMAGKYNIGLTKLGWVNCDRFNNVPGPKTDLIVDLKDDAYSYFTIMIFDQYKSILSGSYAGGSKVVFNNIPAKQHFKIISIGIDKEGNTVLAMKEGPFTKGLIDDLYFEPTSAPDLKNTLSKN